MKKFKVLKSRSSLWREARNLAEVQSESHELAEHDAAVSTASFQTCPAYAESSDAIDMSDNESLNESDVNVAILDEDCRENTIGWHWLHDDDVDCEMEDRLVHDLAEWSLKNNISLSATTSLLSILKPHLPFLPKSAQTLRNTLRHTSHLIQKVNGGEYCHLGLSDGLTRFIRQKQITLDQMELQISVDGIPLFKSSSVSLWPILCLVKNIPFKSPFVVGMFSGKEKPGSASEFLASFVEEACMLIKNGLTVDQHTIKITIHSFVCDAPARAFIKGIKSHSGYSSCEKCTVRGEYHTNKVIFPSVDCPLRTDESFDAMADEDHHIGACPLRPLPLGYVTQFGLDYMHLACLGVMRRLIMYWKGPYGPLQVRLGRKMIGDLSSRLLHVAQWVPVEFARRPRSIDEVLRWKATEFREFMLYSGLLVLRDILSDELYNHFMLLCVSLRILVSRQLSAQYCDYANELLVKFVSDAQVLYGNDILVYNVHCLVHLVSDVKNLGCLDDFSAFVFENKLGYLKKLVHKPQHPLQQILRRLHEEASLDLHESSCALEPILMYEHHNGPRLDFSGAVQYKRVQTDRFTLSLTVGNNCVLVDGCFPAIVRNILKTKAGIVLICAKFVSVQDAFVYPLPSSRLNIYLVSGMCATMCPVSLADVTHKCVCWHLFGQNSLVVDDETFCVLPLLH